MIGLRRARGTIPNDKIVTDDGMDEIAEIDSSLNMPSAKGNFGDTPLLGKVMGIHPERMSGRRTDCCWGGAPGHC